jgi:hypothetical protein
MEYMHVSVAIVHDSIAAVSLYFYSYMECNIYRNNVNLTDLPATKKEVHFILLF